MPSHWTRALFAITLAVLLALGLTGGLFFFLDRASVARAAGETVQFDAAAYNVNEADGTATITVTLTPTSAMSVTVDVTTTDGTASGLSDYTPVSTTLTLAPGNSVVTFTVPITNDLLNEANETFSLTLGNPTNASLGTQDTATVTINDNDPQPSLSINDVTVTETNTSVSAIFTVTLSAASGQTVTVGYATADGTATAPADYTAVLTTSLTFNPGETTHAITVTLAGDALYEASETFLVNLANASRATIGDLQGLGTIGNDDPKPALSINNASVNEGNSGTTTAVFTVTLTGPTELAAAVNYTTADNTATTADNDYVAKSGTLNFPVGTTTQLISVTINGDTIYETNEDFLLNLSAPANADITTGQGTGTITNDDLLPIVNFTFVTYSVNENAGPATITATLSNPSAFVVTVAYTTLDGSAVSGNDYVTKTGTLTFTAGTTIQAFTVPIVNDTIYENSEVLTLELSSAAGATLGTPNPATLTILDDDPAPVVAFNASAYTANESDGSGTITVTLTGATEVTATVNYATSNGTATAGADYTTTTGVLTFTPGVTLQTFTVPILDDNVFEVNETVLLTLSGVTGATIGGANPATLTITPDGDSPPTVQLSAAAYSVNENAGPVVITATLTGQTEITATVNYSTTNGTAAAGSDYTGVAGTLTFTPGVNSQTINVPITDDTTFETNETFTVTLSAQVSSTLVSPTSAVATIVNDDPLPVVRYYPDPQLEFLTLESAASATITVTLDRPSVFTVTVNYSTTNGTAIAGTDYISTTGILTFIPGNLTQTFSVTFPAAKTSDTFDGPDLGVNLNLGGVVSATIGGDNPETLRIVDDDGPPQAYFSTPAYSTNENGSPFVGQIILTNLSNFTITAVVTVTDGTASRLTDYNSPLTKTVTIPSGQATANFSIPITNDVIYEGLETINLALGNLVNAVPAMFNQTAVVTIQDDEITPTVRFSTAAYSVNENVTPASITVTLSGASAFPITVNTATSNGMGVGRATAGADYTAINATVAFNPGTITRTVPVTITNDLVYEGNEVLTLTLSSPVNTTITSTNPVTLTIVDNESPPTIRLSTPTYSVNENAGPAVITVTLTGSTAVTATVNITSSNGTATAGSDYTALNTLVTFAPGVTSQAVNVPINDDAAYEGNNETFNLTLGAPVSATLTSPTTAVGMIFDNDPRPGCTIFNSTDVPKAIPDNAPAGVDSTVVIPGPGILITGTSVRIDQLMHTFDSDLRITLTAPSLITATLVADPGVGDDKDNFFHTIFLDSAPTPIGSAAAPFTGNFRPDLPLSPLNGSASGGTWKLHVVDTASGDVGTVVAWGLEVCGSVTAPTHYLYLPLIRR